MTMLIGNTARIVAFQPGTEPITIQCPQWVWEDPLQLSTGRILVAFADDARRGACVLQHKATRSGTRPEVDWEIHFASIRASREAETLKSNRDNQYAFARAISGPDNRILAAIGASCPAFRANTAHRQLIQCAVRDAAAMLTRTFVDGVRPRSSEEP